MPIGRSTLRQPSTDRLHGLRSYYSLGGDSFVGTAPKATDRDGDTLTYSLSGTGADEFTVDSETREIRTAAGTTDFTGGDEYVLTLSVTDGIRRV